MFKFLKEKLKKIGENFSKEEDLVEEIIEIPKEFEKQIEKESSKLEEDTTKIGDESTNEKISEKNNDEETVIEEKKGFFQKFKERVSQVSVKEEKFDEIFLNIELELLEFNVAVEVIEKIKEDLKKEIVDNKIEKKNLTNRINERVKETIQNLFLDAELLEEKAKEKKPYIILFLGVNGSGKTTTLAKVANYLKQKGFSSVIAACDTFRAAAIQQLEEHAINLSIKLVKHDYGSDAAAVAFDAIRHAESRNLDFVLIDTAGRSHANTNLMDELKKVVRISNPDMKIFVADSLTGNDAIEQAKSFNEKIGIDNIILTKTDTDEKGGAIISVSYITKKPIMFIGNGQKYEDLKYFDRKDFIEQIFN